MSGAARAERRRAERAGERIVTDIAVTWPKSRPLGSYYIELENASTSGLLINFRVSSLPKTMPERCYMVHDGAVRCWNRVVDMCWQPGGRVLDPATGRFMRPGYYIVRDPAYVELPAPVPMRGFQGFRYVDRREMGE